jgi:hypothetical protein
MAHLRHQTAGATLLAAAMIALAYATAAYAAEQSCDAYSAYRRLPQRFVEIASGELSSGRGDGRAIELFYLSDGVCMCANTPSLDRRAEPTRKNQVWSCRDAKDDERVVQ